MTVPGHIVQSVTCLTADPGVTSSNLAWSHTFWKLIIKPFLRPFSSIPLIQEGLLSVARESMCTNYYSQACPGKKCG